MKQWGHVSFLKVNVHIALLYFIMLSKSLGCKRGYDNWLGVSHTMCTC
jgi:hypothetical protein